MTRKPQGFATMTPEKRREIARKGGRIAHQLGRAHEWTSREGKIWGKLGGMKISSDREHMRTIGKLGGRGRSQTMKDAKNRASWMALNDYLKGAI